MIKFRYKRKEPTNIVGSKDTANNSSSLNASTISTKSTKSGSSCNTTNKDATHNEAKENCKPATQQIQKQPQQQQQQQMKVNNNGNTNNVLPAAATNTQTASATTKVAATTLKSSIPTQLITSAPINIVSSTAQHLQHPQHCQMVLTAGTGGTLPRSTPKKMMDPREGHKSATLTRQSNTLQNNRKMLTSMAKVASTAELAAVMGYTNKPVNSNNNAMTSIASGIILSPEAIQDRDRCINAVIVSYLNNNKKKI